MEEEKKEEKQDKKISEKINEQIDKTINIILEQGIQAGNVDFLYKIVDIKKDMAEIEKEEHEMMYGNYGNYDDMSYGRRGVPGTGRGRYRDGDSYGRRGVPGTGRGRYRGEEMIDEMKYHYGNYQESYNNGNYSAKEDSAYKMTEAFKEFGFSIAEELEPNEKMMFKKAMQEIMRELEQ